MDTHAGLHANDADENFRHGYYVTLLASTAYYFIRQPALLFSAKLDTLLCSM